MQVEGQSTSPDMLSKEGIPLRWKRSLPQSVRTLRCFASRWLTSGHRQITWGYYRHEEGSEVHRRFGNLLRDIMSLTFPADRLELSRFDVPDIINHITHCFDDTTKRLFKSLDETSYILFGSPAETEASLNIQRGKMKLSGFVPSLPRKASHLHPSLYQTGSSLVLRRKHRRNNRGHRVTFALAEGRKKRESLRR